MWLIFSKSIIFIVKLTTVILLISNSLNAATTQGSLGSSSSTGTVDINVTSGDQIIIFGMRTFSFGAWALGDGDLADNEDVCIGKSSPASPYAIQATGNGDSIDPSAFTLTNGVDLIYYEVYWNDEVGTVGQVPLSPGSTLYNQDDSPNGTYTRNRLAGGAGNTNCSPGNTGASPRENANLEIRITSASLSAAMGGLYAGVLTLLVIPN